MPEITPQSFADFVRTATRPVLTVISLLAWVMFISEEIQYPPIFQWLVVAMVGEWFSERFLTRFGDMIKK